jgi:hypothetical protein
MYSGNLTWFRCWKSAYPELAGLSVAAVAMIRCDWVVILGVQASAL